MEILPTSFFAARYRKLVKKHPNLSGKVDKQLELFVKNPKTPSLRLHKLSGKNKGWSISITGDLRILFDYFTDGILLLDIGTHDEVY